MAKNNGPEQAGPYHNLFRAVSGGFGHLGTYLAGPKAEWFHRLTITRKNAYDYFAILTRWTEDGKREVAFGSGHDAVAALVGLMGAIARDAWRADRYFEESDGDS